jgi:uncharacterized protein
MKDSPWKPVDVVAYVLIIIGALNWGLVGFFNFNLVAWLFGEATTISRIIYALVGLAGMPRRWQGRVPTEAAARERERMHV